MRTALASCPSRPRLALGLAWLALTVLIATGAQAAPFDLKGQDWEGLSEFLHTAEVDIGSSRVVATSTLDLHRLDPADGVVLVHPTRALDVEELSAFMRAGGHIVLLDDYGTGDELLAKYDVRRLPLPSRPAQTLRGNPALAIAEPAAELRQSLGDLSEVVTNHATGLQQPALSPILVVHGDGEDDVLLSVAGVVGRGRLLAIGDGSVVINSMLRFPGNRKLALAIVRYALEDESWGKRSGKLYVVANDFDTTGSFGQAESPFAGASNEVRRAIEEALDALRHNGVSPVGTYLAALAVGIGVLLWTAARGREDAFVRDAPVCARRPGRRPGGHRGARGGPRGAGHLASPRHPRAQERPRGGDRHASGPRSRAPSRAARRAPARGTAPRRERRAGAVAPPRDHGAHRDAPRAAAGRIRPPARRTDRRGRAHRGGAGARHAPAPRSGRSRLTRRSRGRAGAAAATGRRIRAYRQRA